MSEVRIEEVPYGGWERCVTLTNNMVQLIVTIDIGPRIISYSFPEYKNVMCEIQSTIGLKGGDEWRMYGGHRLWHSPEAMPRTYEPDNYPVAWEKIENGIRTIQEIEGRTGIIKEMEIMLSPDSSRVNILHRLTNKGLWSVNMAVWSISALAPGGKEVIPVTGADTGLLPNRMIALWPYTRLNDPRVRFGEKYLILHQDPNNRQPFKIGIPNEHGWAAYFIHNQLFVKYYNHIINSSYPDFGVSYESYLNDFMLEMETLSPLVAVEPGNDISHMETWELFNNIPVPADDETEIEAALQGRLNPGL